ncbi:MAG: hypothetical protein EBZ77_12245 [Chitinophagia bacterium]|nr:hypothetical protein [Chitinophagia bacterium]
MSTKTKISAKKVLQALLTLVVTTGCVIAMVSAARVQGEAFVVKGTVENTGIRKVHFLQDSDIYKEAITNRGIDLFHTPISKLDLHAMEQVLLTDPWVASAQIFVDNQLQLHIAVTQRVPVLRLFMQTGRDMYMDSTMHLMPTKPYPFNALAVTNVPDLGTDSLGTSIKCKLQRLASVIEADTFWNAQTAEIIMDSATCFELVPVAGDHNIVIGDTDRLQQKLNNVFAFYKNVLNKIGWDKYKVLDARFKGQIVASPSIPYSGKTDHFDKTWLSEILIADARKDSALHALDPRREDFTEPEPAPQRVPAPQRTPAPLRQQAPPAAHARHDTARRPASSAHPAKDTSHRHKPAGNASTTDRHTNGQPAAINTPKPANASADKQPKSNATHAADKPAGHSSDKPAGGSAGNKPSTNTTHTGPKADGKHDAPAKNNNGSKPGATGNNKNTQNNKEKDHKK